MDKNSTQDALNQGIENQFCGQRFSVGDVLDKDVSPALVRIPSIFLNNYFNSRETLKKYCTQFRTDPETFINRAADLSGKKATLTGYIDSDFEGFSLSFREHQVVKAMFSLFDRQKASYEQPYVVLKNNSELYNEAILRRNAPNDQHAYFLGSERRAIDAALESLSKKIRKIVIKGLSKSDKKGAKRYFMYMAEQPLLSIEYFNPDMPEDELTETKLKQEGSIKISILPVFLKGFWNHYKLLPRPVDLIMEIKRVCPNIHKASTTVIDFIDYLHRQRDIAIKRSRNEMYSVLKISKEQLSKRGKRYFDRTVTNTYSIAMRLGYLKRYQTKIDFQTGILSDHFVLSDARIKHLRMTEDTYDQ